MFEFSSMLYNIGLSVLLSCYEPILKFQTDMYVDSGQLQFWSEPSEILNLRSSNTQESVAFTIP